jgi:hypothetical protein
MQGNSTGSDGPSGFSHKSTPLHCLSFGDAAMLAAIVPKIIFGALAFSVGLAFFAAAPARANG